MTSAADLVFVPIRAVNALGAEFWYTGRAGDGWVSPNRSDAFLGYNLIGARRFAMQQNKYTTLHGLRFVAVTSELETANEIHESFGHMGSDAQ